MKIIYGSESTDIKCKCTEKFVDNKKYIKESIKTEKYSSQSTDKEKIMRLLNEKDDVIKKLIISYRELENLWLWTKNNNSSSPLPEVNLRFFILYYLL